MKNILILIAGVLVGFAICHFIINRGQESASDQNIRNQEETVSSNQVEEKTEVEEQLPNPESTNNRTSDNDEGTGVRIAESRLTTHTSEFSTIQSDIESGLSNANREVDISKTYVLGLDEIRSLINDIDLANKYLNTSDDSIRAIQFNMSVSPSDITDTDDTEISGYIDLILVPVTGAGDRVVSNLNVNYSDIQDGTINSFEKVRVDSLIADGITNSLVLNCTNPCPEKCD